MNRRTHLTRSGYKFLAPGFEVVDCCVKFRKPLSIRAYGLVIVTLALAVAELKFASPL